MTAESRGRGPRAEESSGSSSRGGQDESPLVLSPPSVGTQQALPCPVAWERVCNTANVAR